MDTKEYAKQIIEDLLILPKDKILEIAYFTHFLMKQVQQQGIPLSQTGLTQKEVFDLRQRLATFENDWNAPGMEAYDNI